MANDPMRMLLAADLPVTLLAWPGFEIAPDYSAIQVEMMSVLLVGSLVLVVCFFWELVGWYQRMDQRYELIANVRFPPKADMSGAVRPLKTSALPIPPHLRRTS